MKFIKEKAGALIVAVAILLAGLGTDLQDQALGGTTSEQTTASSTTFTLTTTSARLLATSSQRVSALIQPYDCATNDAVYLNEDTDIPATIANSDYLAHATTSLLLSAREGSFVPTNSVQGISRVGCKVKVTEWRNR